MRLFKIFATNNRNVYNRSSPPYCMSWVPMDEARAEKLESVLVIFPCDKKKMFGYDVYFVNNNMFAGLHGTHLFMRFSKEDREDLLETEGGACPFEPRKGLVMREYLSLPLSLLDNESLLIRLLGRSYAYVSALPPKVPKRRRTGPTR